MIKYPHFHKGREPASVLWLLLTSLLKEYSDSANFASYGKLFQSMHSPIIFETSFKGEVNPKIKFVLFERTFKIAE